MGKYMFSFTLTENILLYKMYLTRKNLNLAFYHALDGINYFFNEYIMSFDNLQLYT